jgi:2-oxoglutarate ferredoxin oxidoreductase subunit alpha
MNKDSTIKIAGAAGQGMQTVGFVLGKLFTRSGLQVFALQDNESRIRGGHNFFQMRVAEHPVLSMVLSIDILIALNQNAVTQHQDELSERGVIIYDNKQLTLPPSNGHGCGIPLEQIAMENGGNEIFSNFVALGAVLAIIKADFNILDTFLREFFSSKPDSMDSNSRAARAGYDYVRSHYQHFSLPLPLQQHSQKKMFINAHEAIALGACAAGCQFFSAYPMSPATSILSYLAPRSEKFSMVVEQAEDEIAAINMAIGASFSGVRAMTATSGGGFSLMVESLGFAGISETPLVVVNAQRPGPATGLPTRTEQGDLRFVLHASQGEFPRVILAPSTPREAFYLTIKAFHLAYTYQVPVIILTDQYLADSFFTEDTFHIPEITANDFSLTREELKDEFPYLRYRFTESGVSPRIPPAWKGRETICDSHEHSEDGHITEDALTRKKMVEKRFKKEETIIKEIDPPLSTGSEKSDILIIGWGSNYGVLKEVTEQLISEGMSLSLMHFQEIWPFPKQEVIRRLDQAKRWIVVENNYTGQLAGILQEQTGRSADGTILKYDGRPFFFEELLSAVRKEVGT